MKISKVGVSLCKCMCVLLIIVSSCNFSKDTKLELAFKQAGANKSELEKVIEHYSKNPGDSLKYKAAIFLIENMINSPQKITENNPSIDSLCKKIGNNPHFKINDIDECISDQITNKGNPQLSTSFEPRLKVVKADELIENIDLAFHSWHEFPWNKDLNFEYFCKHVLSCDFGSTSLYGTRKHFINRFRRIKDTLPKAKPWEVSRIIQKEIKKSFRHTLSLSKKHQFLNHLTPQQLIDAQIGGCFEEAILTCMALRSLGLPAAVDFIPQWSDRTAVEHYWCKSLPLKHKRIIKNEHLNPTAHTNPIIPASTLVPGKPKFFNIPKNQSVQYNRRVAKVYRLTEFNTSVQNINKNLFAKNQYKYQLYQDITNKYIICSDIELDIKRRNKDYYLFSFSIDGWNPIAVADYNTEKITFRDVGVNNMFLAAYYKNDELVPIEAPFSVSDSGSLYFYKASKDKIENIILYRKYPLASNIAGYAKNLIGSELEVLRDNTNAVIDSYRIDSMPLHIQEIPLKKPIIAEKIRLNLEETKWIAEIVFYTERDGKLEKINGKPFGNEGIFGHELSMAFDNNWDSYFNKSKNPPNWIAYNFSTPTKIAKIQFAPRSDTNYLIPGNTYRLMAWVKGKWVVVGEKKAISHTINFNNVPTNCVLWLRCLDGGKEERVFSYENGEQVWW